MGNGRNWRRWGGRKKEERKEEDMEDKKRHTDNDERMGKICSKERIGFNQCCPLVTRFIVDFNYLLLTY